MKIHAYLILTQITQLNGESKATMLIIKVLRDKLTNLYQNATFTILHAFHLHTKLQSYGCIYR